jgi:hypothetical protein
MKLLFIDEQARGHMLEQDREIAENSGRALERRAELVTP